MDRGLLMNDGLPENHGLCLCDPAEPNRRDTSERRRAPTGPWDSLRFFGRRRKVRRATERGGPFFVDRFDAITLAVVVGVLALSIIDGVLTIELLDINSEEVNPVMGFFLGLGGGHRPFLLGKYILTAIGLPFLVVFKNWPLFGTRFRAGFLLPVFLGLYIGLLVYQVHLLEH
jgi:Domain of unknown function (DUF5658)